MHSVESINFLPLASRTGAQTSKETVWGSGQAASALVATRNWLWRGIKVFVNVPSSPGSGSITVKVFNTDGYGNDFLLLQSAAITGAGQTVLTVHPTIPAVTNVTAQDTLGGAFHVDVVDNNGVAFNYSISYAVLP